MKKRRMVVFGFMLIAVLCAVGVFSQNRSRARETQIYLEVPDSIKKENEFTVRVLVDSDINLYSVDAYLSYSADTLEFIPDSKYVSGTDGVLELKDIYGEETKKAEYEITFKAKETGSAEVALTDVYLINYEDLDYITVSSKSKQFEIGINHEVEKDASLEELIVAPGQLTEPFSPDVTEYEMHVGMDIESIGISAIPVDESSVVELDMPEKLAEGENKIVIKVTALSGNVKTYTIMVIRKDWQEETSAQEENGTETDENEENFEEKTENQSALDTEQSTEAVPIDQNQIQDSEQRENTSLELEEPATEADKKQNEEPVQEIAD